MNSLINTFIRDHSTCVLCSTNGSSAYGSLMGYYYQSDKNIIWMATLAGTRKYENLLSYPHIALLIDNRSRHDGQSIKSLTIEGEIVLRKLMDNVEIKEQIMAVNPLLSELLVHPDCVLIQFNPRTFVWADGPTRVIRGRMSDAVDRDHKGNLIE